MDLPLPDPVVRDTAGAQRNFDYIRSRLFPLTRQFFGAGSVGPNELADGSVTTPKIADDAVTSAKIPVGAVGTTEIADNAATTAKLDLGVASGAQLLNGAATGVYTTTATTSGPTTGAGPTALAEMSVTANFGGNPVVVCFSGQFGHSAVATGNVELFDAGVSVAQAFRGATFAAGEQKVLTILHSYTPGLGSRTLDIRFSTNAATLTATTTRRQLIVVELRR